MIQTQQFAVLSPAQPQKSVRLCCNLPIQTEEKSYQSLIKSNCLTRFLLLDANADIAGKTSTFTFPNRKDITLNIQNPSHVLRLSKIKEDLTDDGSHYLFRMKRNASMFLLTNRNAFPTFQQYCEAAHFLTEITGLNVSANQAEELLALYPDVRIKIAVYQGIADTDVRDGLSFVAAHFFLGTSWPTIGDDVDIDAWLHLLQREAKEMGFTVATAFA